MDITNKNIEENDDTSSVGSINSFESIELNEFINVSRTPNFNFDNILDFPIYIKELNKNFRNFYSILGFIDDNIKTKNQFNCLELPYTNFKLELCFRNKQNLIKYFCEKYNLTKEYKLHFV